MCFKNARRRELRRAGKWKAAWRQAVYKWHLIGRSLLSILTLHKLNKFAGFFFGDCG